ncbi:hypothetical protein PZN02_005685 [Sinorhizobium garamanticum]|uniref:Uncharacterized protein n=1 Tax=Sinorhizobium garamanticum TaxID=680247 RepID=A0ABY8DK42_9HYPH|nr:hypothetical protein [Sinorhizobium garamanticum]WEX90312.1 hypothetical protein PZN02_005685 [Sinorhizobium garamanticum]
MPISKATDADKLRTERRQKPIADREDKPDETRETQWVRRDEENLRARESLFWRGIWMAVF